MRTRAVTGFVASLFLVACSSSSKGESSPADAATSGTTGASGGGSGTTGGSGATGSGATGGTGAAGGSGTSGSGATDAGACSGPLPTSVPAQWTRPADCGGVGNLCPDGCNGAACQLLNNTCVPFAGVGASATACTPYCLDYACMTFDQASCFCTGDAGAQFSACACGPQAIAGLCASEGAACGSTPCCTSCGDLACVTDSVSGSVCRQSCNTNGDCATGCCDTTAHRCHDALYCNCADAGAECAGGGPSCCPGTTCLSFSSDGGGPYACYVDCTKLTDCSSGCCSQTISGLTYGACGPCQ
jgi:hypothetical protein